MKKYHFRKLLSSTTKIYSCLVLSCLVLSCSKNENNNTVERKSKLSIEQLQALANRTNPKVSAKDAAAISTAFYYSHIMQSTKSIVNDVIITDTITQLINSVITKSGGNENVTAPLYIFNLSDNKKDTLGYIIVSGDKRVEGVIAYVPDRFYDGKKLNNGFDILIEQLPNYVLQKISKSEAIADEANEIVLYDIKPGEEVEEIENLLSSDTVEVYNKLLDFKTKWGQYYPYNKYTSGYPAGCVATAVAQIMAYCKYPASIGGYTMNWNQMTASANANNLSEIYQDQVGRLFQHIGIGVEMQYAMGGSLSNGVKAANYLSSIGYTHDGYSEYNCSNTSEKIKLGYPSYMRGSSNNEATGHAWVVTGCKEKEVTEVREYLTIINRDEIRYRLIDSLTTTHSYFFLNFGWDGSEDKYCNAYIYSVDALNFTHNLYTINGIHQ